MNLENEVKLDFYGPDHIGINKSRIEHLEFLDLDFLNKTVLETGCGGRGDLTKFLLDKGAIVTLNDPRKENIACLLKNLGTIGENCKSNNWDLNEDLFSQDFIEKSFIENPPSFDVIFSYGTLYHLGCPDIGIKNMAKMCKDFLIMSTCVSKDKGISVNIVSENKQTKNQSFTGTGCRPTREWVFTELKKYFKYVYTSKYQPNHNDYPCDWISGSHVNRAIFFATNNEKYKQGNEKWSETLPVIQEKIKRK